MDTNIGVIELTEKQVSRLNELKTEVIKGFCYWNNDNKVIVVSTRKLTDQEIADLKISVAALPDSYSQETLIQKFSFDTLWGEVWAGALSPVGLVELPPYQSAIEAMWNYPNRSAIYPYMQALVAAGKGNASDLQIIIDAFAAQNIDITTVQ